MMTMQCSSTLTAKLDSLSTLYLFSDFGTSPTSPTCISSSVIASSVKNGGAQREWLNPMSEAREMGMQSTMVQV
jgi:hypothetical protein